MSDTKFLLLWMLCCILGVAALVGVAIGLEHLIGIA